jgi:hypothetical protein
MPIQWGPCVKKLAEVGVDTCSCCHEPAPFSVYGQSTQIRFMFLVPLADFNAKKFLVCERCKQSWELEEGRASGLIAESKMLPDHETIAAIWNSLDSAVTAALKSAGGPGPLKRPGDAIAETITKLKSTFPSSHVDYAPRQYLKD